MKDVQNLYDENYKTIKKEIEKDIKRRINVPRSRFSRINIIKISILPKAICRFSVTQTLTRLEKMTERITWKHKGSQIGKAVFLKS